MTKGISDFDSVGKFHRKFGLATSTDGLPRFMSPGLEVFRVNFLEEELREFREGLAERDLPKAADSLIDLVYVALGTAHLMGIPWPELFAEVQRVNMAKERATADGGNSARGSSFDVVKPAGWQPPNVIEILMQAGWSGPPLPLEVETT